MAILSVTSELNLQERIHSFTTSKLQEYIEYTLGRLKNTWYTTLLLPIRLAEKVSIYLLAFIMSKEMWHGVEGYVNRILGRIHSTLRKVRKKIVVLQWIMSFALKEKINSSSDT